MALERAGLRVDGGRGSVEAVDGVAMGRYLALARVGVIPEFTLNFLFQWGFSRVLGYSHLALD